MADAAVQAVARSAGRQALAKKVVSQERRLKRIGVEGARIAEAVMEVAIGGGTALGFGWLSAKFPQMRKIPGTEIDTALVGGALLTVFSLFSKSKMAGAMQSAGMGLLLPWLFQKGEEIGSKP